MSAKVSEENIDFLRQRFADVFQELKTRDGSGAQHIAEILTALALITATVIRTIREDGGPDMTDDLVQGIRLCIFDLSEKCTQH